MLFTAVFRNLKLCSLELHSCFRCYVYIYMFYATESMKDYRRTRHIPRWVFIITHSLYIRLNTSDILELLLLLNLLLISSSHPVSSLHILWVMWGRHQNTQQSISKADKSLLLSLQNSAILLVCKSMQRFDKRCLQFTKRH